MLFCRNCGGKLVLGESSEEILCEHCGNTQAIQSMINGTVAPIYVGNSEVGRALNTYQRAMNMFMQSKSERELNTAAQMFRNIPDVLNAKDMVQKCQEKSAFLAKENSYRQAVEDMRSEDSQRVRTAVETLHLLADYKDACQKETEARSLLEVALRKERETEAVRKRGKRIERLIAVAALVVILLIVVIVITGKAARYDSDNLMLSLSPDDDYLTVKSNRYIFYYEVEIENNGPVDIKGFCADVVIEDADGKTLVDTQMQVSNSTALVREGKSLEMTWELTVRDEDVALALYEDFSDLEVSIIVTQIEFADGKVKDY